MNLPTKYRLSTGTEGAWFMGKYCDNCVREEGSEGCVILLHSLIYNKDEEGYPDEWTYDVNDNPICTSFSAEREKEVAFINPNQLNLYEEQEK